MADPGLRLAAAIAAVLVVASAVTALLKWRVAGGRPHATIDNVTARIRSWWVIAALLGTVFVAGRAATATAFAVIALLAWREYVVAAPRPDLNRLRTWLEGFVVCVLCIACIPALLWLDLPGTGGHGGQSGPERTMYPLVFLILVAQASDVLQYLWGKLCGRHRIAPAISPGKTVEGLAGGVISATGLGAGVWWLTPFTPLQAAATALAITLLGFAGGLYLSAQKRRRGIKDWGTLIAGHGGLLDRLDSLWLPAPFYYLLLRMIYYAG